METDSVLPNENDTHSSNDLSLSSSPRQQFALNTALTLPNFNVSLRQPLLSVRLPPIDHITRLTNMAQLSQSQSENSSEIKEDINEQH